jgi:S1-C subfamily serine protease
MKKILLILFVILGFMFTLFAGTIAGASLAYVLLRARPAMASGLSAQEIAAATQNRDDGILVSGVTAGSPAEEAGIVRGDILLSINGEEVNSLADFAASLEALEAGETAALQILHGDEVRSFDVTIPEPADHAYLGIQPCGDLLQIHPFLGTPGEEGFDLPFLNAPGAVITSVVEESPAADAGLQVGDVIASVGDEEVTAENDLASLIGGYAPGDSVTLSIQREGEEELIEIEVTLGENPEDSERAYLGVSFRPAGMLQLGEGQLPLDQLPLDQLPFELPDLENLPFGGGTPNVNPFDLPEGVENAILIAEVLADTPAEQAGLETGDLITAVDGETVAEADQLVEVIRAHQPGDEITLMVIRQGSAEPEEVVIVLGENPENPDQAYLGVRIQSISRIQEVIPPDLENFQFPGWPFENPDQTPPLFEEEGQSS